MSAREVIISPKGEMPTSRQADRYMPLQNQEHGLHCFLTSNLAVRIWFIS